VNFIYVFEKLKPIGPKPGFNFRQMLRDGRDKSIILVDGAYQERPNTRWKISRKKIDKYGL